MLFSADSIFACVPIKIPVGQALWPDKQSLAQLKVMEDGDPYTFNAQMQQDPTPVGGGMFKVAYWRYYDVLPNDINCVRIYADTAQKVKERNDYSVFQAWARSPSQGLFLLDQIRGKWEAPELESVCVDFWNKHKPTIHRPMGAQVLKVEDKSSGSSLIQSIKKDYLIPIEPIQRAVDKVFRAMGVVKYFASGYIHLPRDAEWLSDYKQEFRQFTPMMTHKFDDQLDPTMDAVEDLIVFESMLYTADNIGM